MRREGPLAVLSYARADLPVVLALAWRLRDLGMRTGIDVENLRAGETWQAAIQAAMRRSDAFVPCISAFSLKSTWASLELDTALAIGMPVVPVLLDPAAAPMLPRSLLRMRRIDAVGISPDETAACVALRCARHGRENGTASRARTGDPWFHKPVL